MKKILLFAAMIFASGTTFAQTPTPALRMANDTISNAVTTYAYFGTVASKGAINGGVGSLGWIYKVTKVSGTVAAVVTLEVSDDGLDWITATEVTADTLTDVSSQIFRERYGYASDKFYRLKIVPSGTQKAVFEGNFSVRDN